MPSPCRAEGIIDGLTVRKVLSDFSTILWFTVPLTTAAGLAAVFVRRRESIRKRALEGRIARMNAVLQAPPRQNPPPKTGAPVANDTVSLPAAPAPPDAKPPDTEPAAKTRSAAKDRGKKGRSGCRWRRDGPLEETRFVRWICVECQVEAFSATKDPPVDCKRYLQGGGVL